MDILIKKLDENDFEEASKMIFLTFYKYILPTYTTEGVEHFRDTTSPLSFKMNTFDGSITLYGAYLENTLVGVLGKKGDNHICLFFTHRDYMNMGIGRKLFNYFLTTVNKSLPVTVNASDFGIPIYKKLGFKVKEARHEENGIVYTPMEFIANSVNSERRK